MNDLLRSYKMILKRKNSRDSDSESQPLVSSESSIASFGAFQDQCMFHNSDSSECEVEKSTKPVQQIQTTPKQFLRRPLSYPGQYEIPNFDLFATKDDNSYDKRRYFNKLSGILSDNNIFASSSCYYQFKLDKLEAIKTQNSLVTIFAIWNTIMGSSLLAMAWGFERSGLISGIILHIIISGICLYTAQLVLNIGKNYGAIGKITEVPELCRELLGKWAEVVARIFSLIVLVGANIVYWILMSNFLYNFVEFLYEYIVLPENPENRTVLCPKHETFATIKNNSIHSTRTTYFHEIWDLNKTVPLFLALLMFPLLNFKSPTFFTKFNSLGTLSALYMVIFVCVKAYSWGINDMDWLEELNFKPSFSALSGMLALSYFIHNIIISVMRSNRNQENNVRDLSIAYGLVLFTYLFVGVFFYICFPLAKSCIEDNLLNNFPQYDPMTIGARVLLLFQLFTVFPLMAFMLRLDIFNNFKAIFTETKSTEFSYFRVIVLNVILVIVCVLFACFLPKIGTLIRYTGALSGMVYVFTLPSLMKMSALKNEKALSPLKIILYVTIIVIGVLNFCSQFFIADG
nr:sodium-coupled neutral amino acid transporter 9 homolog [Onthophagus taurus]